MAIHTNHAYIWSVTYHDGSQIHEFDDPNSTGRSFAEVDSNRARLLELQPNTEQARRQSVLVPLGALPIFFRRGRTEIKFESGAAEHTTIHCIGWKRDDQAVYLFVFADGSTLLTNDPQVVHHGTR